MSLDQSRGPLRIARGERVLDSLVGEIVLVVPRGRRAVDGDGTLRALGREPGPQQVGEQVVVPPPAPDVVERDEEQVRPLDLLERRLAVGPAGDGVAQLPAQPIEDRGLQQERPKVVGLAIEHLLGEVVQHVAVAAGERRDELVDRGAFTEGQRRELEPGGRALGPLGEGAGGIERRGRPHRLPEQLDRLAQREPQVCRADLRQTAARAEPRQRQRPSPAGNHHLHPGGCSSRNATDA